MQVTSAASKRRTALYARVSTADQKTGLVKPRSAHFGFFASKTRSKIMSFFATRIFPARKRPARALTA